MKRPNIEVELPYLLCHFDVTFVEDQYSSNLQMHKIEGTAARFTISSSSAAAELSEKSFSNCVRIFE